MSLTDVTDLISSAVGSETSFTINTIVKIAMSVVEVAIHMASKSYTGDEKFELAKGLIPQVLDVAVKMGKLTQDRADDIARQLSAGADVLHNIVNFIIDLSNNPNVIQFGKWVQDECKKCYAARTKTIKRSKAKALLGTK